MIQRLECPDCRTVFTADEFELLINIKDGDNNGSPFVSCPECDNRSLKEKWYRSTNRELEYTKKYEKMFSDGRIVGDVLIQILYRLDKLEKSVECLQSHLWDNKR